MSQERIKMIKAIKDMGNVQSVIVGSTITIPLIFRKF